MTNSEALCIQHRVERRLLHLSQMLEAALQENKDMAVSPEIAAFVTKVDTATDLIAGRISKLMAQSPTLSAEDKVLLQQEVDKLNLLGQDPNNAVPATVLVP